MSRQHRRASAKTMKLALTIKTLNGESTDVTARFADFVAFERTWNRSIAKLETRASRSGLTKRAADSLWAVVFCPQKNLIA